jgi:lipid-A-disaccharide synthase-like uncharacterized protein
MRNWHFDVWVAFGLIGQIVFGSRFIVQWVASERKKASYIPIVFWYLSLTGGIITLIYAVHVKDTVFTVSQVGGLIVYVRNLMLINRFDARPDATPPASPDRP